MLSVEDWLKKYHSSDAWLLFRRQEANFEHLHEQGDLFILNIASELNPGAANSLTKKGACHKTRESH
jgi:hypothetical protein